MAEEWVDHSLDMAGEAKNKLEAAEKAYTDANKKLKEILAQLIKVEKAHRNAESTLKAHTKFFTFFGTCHQMFLHRSFFSTSSSSYLASSFKNLYPILLFPSYVNGQNMVSFEASLDNGIL